MAMDANTFNYQLKYGLLDDYTEQEINKLMKECGLNPHEHDEEVNLTFKQFDQQKAKATQRKNHTNRRRI